MITTAAHVRKLCADTTTGSWGEELFYTDTRAAPGLNLGETL